ncbi:MAG: hypothetical protein K6D03_00210 [Solobacterium sp.]|nr:hypothetical protein [Solobacterium sp.]
MAGEVRKVRRVRRVKRNSLQAYKRRLAVGRRFYRKLFKVFLATVIICATALAYMYFWLYRYEKRSVTGAMRQYFTDVENHNWDKLYETDTEYFVEFNTKESFTKFLTYMYDGIKAGGMTFTWMDGTDTEKYYDAYYQQTKRGTLECIKPDNSQAWIVHSLISGKTYQFDVIGNTTFAINNIKVTSQYAKENGIPAVFEDSGFESLMPSVNRYEIPNFIDAPEIQLSDPGYIAVRDYSGNRFYIGPRTDNELFTEYAKEIEATAVAYCKYITEDGYLYDLRQHLVEGTDFDTAIRSFDNGWFSNHDSIEFQNMVIDNVISLGDDAFIGEISFDYVVTAGTNVKTYSSAYQMYFVRQRNKWKTINIYTISDTASEENG